MKKQILIVEDDPTMAVLLDHVLSKNYQVANVSSGAEAIDFIERGDNPDLIVCDLGLPGVSGEDLLQHFKESPMHNHIPVVVLSGKKKSQDRIACLSMGAEDFVTKPFNPEELTFRISRLLKSA